MYYSLESKKSRYRLYADHGGGGFVEQLELEFPFKSYDTYYYVGSCSGLICFSDYLLNYLRIVLWNPSARSHRLVPIPRILDSDVSFYDVLSFGFDEKCGEYKVLRLIHVYGRHSAIVGQIEAEIYEVKTNLWRQVSVIVPCTVPHCSRQAFLNGFGHWIGFSRDAPHLKMVVMSFDFHGETFREMDLPDGAALWSTYNLMMTVHRGSLCLIEKDVVSGLCIWIMNKYGIGSSWTKLFTIDLVGDLGRWERVLGFRTNGEVLMVTENDELVSCDPESGKISRLGLHGIQISLEAVQYMECLSLLCPSIT
ncbi:hypothetical protein MLD38_015166 [Melastoma candidum]|nr:hypothetical protein MLD38_015166 [Melastoma candidum]